jgi:hypothetical protein
MKKSDFGIRVSIETDCSYQATVTINGRKLVYGYNAKEGVWLYQSGLSKEDRENTIGGMVAEKLMTPLMEILQGWMPEYDNPKTGECWKVWEKLDEECADKVYTQMKV